MLVEEGPDFTTPRLLRLGVEEFERRALAFAKALREQRERTGGSAMAAFMGDGGEARAIPIHNDR
jgi:ATP-dependent RNA circularization protein (DNA/RNA ligase family)